MGVAKYQNGVYQRGRWVYDQYTNELPEFSNFEDGSAPGKMPNMSPGETSGYEVWRYVIFQLSDSSTSNSHLPLEGWWKPVRSDHPQSGYGYTGRVAMRTAVCVRTCTGIGFF